jgi:glycosyltransferase involved in cell wall biosynthesis
MPRILYLHPSFMPPPRKAAADRFAQLSAVLEGEVVQAIWFATPEEVEREFGPGSYPVLHRGQFRYHWFLAWRYRGIGLRLRSFRFFAGATLRLCRENKIDVLVAYSHMANGLLSVLLKFLTRTPLVIEIVTAPHLAPYANSPRSGWRERLNKLYSDLALHISVGLCDRVHLLHPGQLDRYPLLRNKRAAVFPEFVPTSHVPRRQPETGAVTIFLLGAPWFLKGVDLLLAAFRRLAPDFPEARLRLQGHFEDDPALFALAKDCPRTEILKAAPNPETLERMSRASIFVLPSRCEGLPRVIIEAMACGLPLVGSDAGGIPHLIRDGDNGFVVPMNDAAALEAALRRLLADPDLRQRMGERSYELAQQSLTEEQYRQCFRAMVDQTLASSGGARSALRP